MGTKIKPAFKSDFPLATEGWHLFRITEPKIEVIAPEERKEKDGITNDQNFVVRSVIEGGEDDGIELLDYFPNHSKKEFGLSRLAGLMIKTEALPLKDEIDVETMRSEAFESKFKMSLPKRLFGGRVRHVQSKGEDKERIMQNIVEYLTVKEYNEKVAEMASKGIGGTSKGSDKGKKGKEASEGKEEAKETPKDPWAA
jgi:hypothetical protein